MIVRHAEVVEEMRQMWLDLAPKLWRMANGERTLPDGYGERTAERMAAKVLSPAKLAEGMAFEQTVRIVPIPAEAQADMLAQERLRRERRLGADRAALVHDFERDLEVIYADRRKDVVAFADAVASQMAGSIATLCAEIHAALQGKAVVGSRTAEKLRRLIADVRALNFVDDALTSQRLDLLVRAVDAKDVTPASLAKALEKVHEAATRDMAEDVRKDESFALVWRLDDEEELA